MWVHLNKATTGVSDDYALEPSVYNWFGCKRFGGFRLAQWAQETGSSSLSSPLLDDVGVPKAFCLPDLEFRLCNNRRFSLREAFGTPEDLIHHGIVTFTHQKNGNNGEKRKFLGNSTNPSLCFVALMLRIFKQFIHLVGWEATSTPLAIYRTDTSDIRFITAADINTVVRTTAAAVYGLHKVKN
jgi:hypothetical protein